MAPHSSTLAWKIPWTEEPGRLQSMGSEESDTTERLHFHFSVSCIREESGNPLQCSCLEWVAISFSNAWKWKVKVKSLSRVRLFGPHGLQPTRFLRPWDSPGKSTGVGCHCLLCCFPDLSPNLQIEVQILSLFLDAPQLVCVLLLDEMSSQTQFCLTVSVCW